MNSKPSCILIDTCVWIDNYLGFRPGSGDARALLDAAIDADISLAYAVTTIKDVYYLVNRILKAQIEKDGLEVTPEDRAAIDMIAWECLSNMEEIATAVGMDSSDVWFAKRYRAVHDDFEDDLVIAAARRAKADVLVTNDERLLRDAPVAALSTKDALKLIRAFEE